MANYDPSPNQWKNPRATFFSKRQKFCAAAAFELLAARVAWPNKSRGSSFWPRRWPWAPKGWAVPVGFTQWFGIPNWMVKWMVCYWFNHWLYHSHSDTGWLGFFNPWFGGVISQKPTQLTTPRAVQVDLLTKHSAGVLLVVILNGRPQGLDDPLLGGPVLPTFYGVVVIVVWKLSKCSILHHSCKDYNRTHGGQKKSTVIPKININNHIDNIQWHSITFNNHE